MKKKKERVHRDLDNVIMDMAYAGMSDEAIAQEVGISAGRVRTVISYMQVGSSDLAFGASALEASSDALLAAIKAAYPGGAPF